ncbi:MAG: acyl-CoA dehydrogenase [Mycobacterium sp.]
MTADLIRRWLSSGELDLPLPGSGRTADRWSALTALTETDVVSGRLAEAHCDAVAILAELGGQEPQRGKLWGVWAAEPPNALLTARVSGDVVRLDGTKAWCSGAGMCDNALVTARLDDGRRALFAVSTDDSAVRPLPTEWHNAGMADSDTRSVEFDGAAGVPVGLAGAYLNRSGFWHGAIGVAACWLGGTKAVAAQLYRKARDDEHALAHLGAVDAAISAADAVLAMAAAEIDADPADRAGGAERRARRVRATVEHAVDEAITRTGRALGPGPLTQDKQHAARVADLTIYVRQSHGERDLAALGRVAQQGEAG